MPLFLVFKDFTFTRFLCVSECGFVYVSAVPVETEEDLRYSVNGGYTVVSCPVWALWTELRSSVEALNYEPSFQPRFFFDSSHPSLLGMSLKPSRSFGKNGS